MQALSISPLRNDSWSSCMVPHLDCGLIVSCNSVKKRHRRKRSDFGDCLGRVSYPGLLYISGHSRAGCKSEDFVLSCNFFSAHVRPKLYFFSKPRKNCFGMSFALAWALEEQAVGHNVAEEHLDPCSELSEEKQNPGFSQVQLEGVKVRNLAHIDDYDSKSKHGIDDDDDDDEGNYDNEEEGIDGEDNMRNEHSGRIDVQALAWSLHSAKTIDDVEEVLKDKAGMPLQVYSSMIRGFGKDKKVECARALVEWLKKKSREGNSSLRPNLFIYNSLLGALKQAENYDFVDQVIHNMAMEGVDPNIVTYNTLMAIYIEQGREVEALNLFEETLKKGLSPSPASYSTVLFAYRRLEDGFGALKFFVEIKDKYLAGEIGKDGEENWEHEFTKLENFAIRICYQVMRRWLVKSENLSTNVLRLLNEMDKAGLHPGRAELERLVWACTHEKDCSVAKELYTRIREQRTEISLSVCNHVIWLMGKAKKWWAALEIYEDLLDEGPKPNNMSYELIVSHFNILLTAAKKRGIWRWGVRLLNKMEEKGLKPGSREWNSVLVACSKASETSAAVQIFRRMVDQGEKPTVISYGALLSALEKGKLYDEALQVWKHMLKVGVQPNLYAYTIMASIYAVRGQFNIVDSIIREMVTVGVEPTVVTFNAIISGCARNNMGSAAYEWFQRMKHHNISPNEVTYEMLIEGLSNDGKPRLAYELYLRAQNEGLTLSSKAYDAVFRSSQVHGASIDVSALGPRPPEKKKNMKIRKKLSQFCNLADVPRRSKPFDRKEIYSAQAEELHK